MNEREGNSQHPRSQRPGGTIGSKNNGGNQREDRTDAVPSHGPGRHGRGGRIEKAKDVRGTLKRLLAYLSPYRWAFVAIFLLVILTIAFDLAAPVLMGQAIDVLIGGFERARLVRIVLIMLTLYLLSWLSSVGQGLLVTRVSQQAMRQLRQDLFEHIQTLSLAFFDKHPHGELMSRLTNDMQAISGVLTQNVTSLFSGLLTLVGIVVMMFYLNVWLALASMLILPAMMLFVGYVGKRTRQGFRQYQRHLGILNGQLEEMFSGQRVIIAFGREGQALEDFDEANVTVRDIGLRAMTYSMLVPPLMGILSNANIAVIAGLGGWMTFQEMATVGTIATFYTYSRRFAAPLRHLGDLYNQIQSAIAGAERIFEILDQETELIDSEEAVALDDVHGEVVFDHVDFCYEADVPVIRDMSFRAEPGQTIALVGPTGAGKTTIINLLSRFYDVQSGSITIDGCDIREIDKHQLRRKLGVVLQDTFLFADTLMENIRYGRLDAMDEEVVEAAKLANAHQFIERLPNGYEEVLSERGSNLSQGQRQLLSIARAILADPGILILDEATSSVDTRTESQIQKGLLELMEGRTSFVIAHRLSTIRDADKILVINEGQIIEKGTHDDLLDDGGSYYDLYMSQFKGRVD